MRSTVVVARQSGSSLVVVVGLHAHVVRMQARVEPREARDDRVLVDEERVAGDQVAAIDALADEDRVLEGAVVVVDVELVEAAVDAGELERRAAHAHGAAARS